jgi:hypothetical protein
MGQQQLILLVLATVIVGIAIVVGIRAFTENDAKANADAMMQDAVRMASDIQAAIKKPDPFGGVDAFTDIDFGVLGYPNTGGVYTNLNGQFELAAAAAGVVITGVGPDSTQALQEIVVAVCGLQDDDIEGAVTEVGGQPTGATAPSCS